MQRHTLSPARRPHRLRLAAFLVGNFALSACMGANRNAQGNRSSNTSSSSATETTGSAAESEASATHFESSLTCAQCHSNSSSAEAMRDEADNPIGFFDLWRSSMMANAARDPLWRAVVSAESARFPSATSDIERTCMRCHAPMAGAEPNIALLDRTSERAELARDGVSCAVCHQIEPTGLGTEASFSGGFELNDQALIYGPHSDPFSMPMERFTGYTPVEAKHVQSSALCGTCHTLQTHALTEDGEAAGPRLPEQAPYLEWRNSSFNDEDGNAQGQSCQDCHMPTASEDGIQLRAALARNPGGMDFPRVTKREPYARHVFVGGNTLIPAILRDNAEALEVTAPKAAFDATIRLATEQLQKHTATLHLAGLIEDAGLSLDVSISNLTGHKFPTGHPARRAWLRVEVVDADELSLFSSGAFDEDGVLVDASASPLASELSGGPTQPHYDRITSSEQAYVLETVMLDDENHPTTSLLRGASYGKDNRLLPRGFSYEHPDIAWMTPVGVTADEDFEPGGDTITYQVDVSDGKEPFTVVAELLFQPLSARYAAELFEHDTPEVERFRSMYGSADKTPVVVARRELVLDGSAQAEQ